MNNVTKDEKMYYSISEVSKICTSIAVLNQGRLAYHDKIAGVLARFKDEETLEELYLSLNSSKAA